MKITELRSTVRVKRARRKKSRRTAKELRTLILSYYTNIEREMEEIAKNNPRWGNAVKDELEFYEYYGFNDIYKRLHD